MENDSLLFTKEQVLWLYLRGINWANITQKARLQHIPADTWFGGMVKGRSAKKSLIFVTVRFSSGQNSFIEGPVSKYFKYGKVSCRELGDFLEPNDVVKRMSWRFHSLQSSEIKAQRAYFSLYLGDKNLISTRPHYAQDKMSFVARDERIKLSLNFFNNIPWLIRVHGSSTVLKLWTFFETDTNNYFVLSNFAWSSPAFLFSESAHMFFILTQPKFIRGVVLPWVISF